MRELLRVGHLQASTGFGADPTGHGYGGKPSMTLEEAIDLAEREVQGIVSLVNVLYTDQVRHPASRQIKGEQEGWANRPWEVVFGVLAPLGERTILGIAPGRDNTLSVYITCPMCTSRPTSTTCTRPSPATFEIRGGLTSHACKGGVVDSSGHIATPSPLSRPLMLSATRLSHSTNRHFSWSIFLLALDFAQTTRNCCLPVGQLRLYVELKRLEIRTEAWKEPPVVLGEQQEGAEEKHLNPLEAHWNHEPLDHTKKRRQDRLEHGCPYSRQDGVELKVR